MANPTDDKSFEGKSPETPYQVYILACEDGSFYTGITTDIVRRIREHLSGATPGARYTQQHRPVALSALWDARSRSDASSLEYRIKQLSHAEKESLISGSLSVEDIAASGYFERVDEVLLGEIWAEAVS